jgi:hypothetical protein
MSRQHADSSSCFDVPIRLRDAADWTRARKAAWGDGELPCLIALEAAPALTSYS